MYSTAKQDYQQQTQQLQEQITKLQQEVQKLKPLESQVSQTQQQGSQQPLKGRESVDEEGTSSTLKIPLSSSRTGGRLFRKRVGCLAYTIILFLLWKLWFWLLTELLKVLHALMRVLTCH